MHHLRYALYNIWLRHVSRSCSIKNSISRKLTRLIRGLKGAGATDGPNTLFIPEPYKKIYVCTNTSVRKVLLLLNFGRKYAK